MKIIVMILSLLLVNTAFCDVVSTSLQNKLNQIKTMTANFSQTVKTKRRGSRHSSGVMALSRPGHFRWQTKSPTDQLIVADGKRLWVYDKDLEQVAVKRQARGVGGTVGLFLSGYGQHIARDFLVTVSKQGAKEIYDLRPRSGKASIQRVRLTFQGAALVGLELFDQLGQYSMVHLNQVKTNVALPQSLFQFSAPRGVDVVQQ